MTIIQKGEPMAEIKVPIQVNLPVDWVEQIVNRLRNDPEAEWVEIIRCKDCKYWKDSDGVYRRGFDAESKCPLNLKKVYEGTFYCGMAERRTDG